MKKIVITPAPQEAIDQSLQALAWLQAQGLQDAEPLWKSLHVDAGWETAVESVLRERLAALAADFLERLERDGVQRLHL